jgi:hypothetical protein
MLLNSVNYISNKQRILFVCQSTHSEVNISIVWFVQFFNTICSHFQFYNSNKTFQVTHCSILVSNGFILLLSYSYKKWSDTTTRKRHTFNCSVSVFICNRNWTRKSKPKSNEKYKLLRMVWFQEVCIWTWTHTHRERERPQTDTTFFKAITHRPQTHTAQ